MNHVIIGNGIAGVSAAESIRELDGSGSIFMISDEPVDPYCRPMISLVLEGAISPSKLPIRGPDFYESLNITPVLGSRVARMDVDAKILFLSDGKTLPYDTLLIASGADPRPIKAAAAHLTNIFFMRNQHQVLSMLKTLPQTRHALVLGGGLVGFKAAGGLLHRGIGVTMLIRSGYPLSLQVDETAGGMILAELIRRGLNVRVGVEVTGFKGSDTVTGAFLSDGSEVSCDLVIVGKGVLPSVSFVPRDRIRVDLGIVVDDHLETSCPGIFAAGDVAESVDIARKTRWVNAIWPEAVAQGRIAGMNMAGRAVAYKGSLSRNVIRIFDLDIMAAGWVNAPDDPRYSVISEHNRRLNTYRRLVFEGDRLIGATLVNRIETGGILTAMIQNEIPVRVSKRKLLEPHLSLKSLTF
ncbi:MAG: NAD(P)/FAD-dependent oxidoreductase [Deltaproteobacteria bacterium]|nr:NAD(P)/FAD-dependent oxidoreductase [Deltaproteobacteria bacterium]